MSRIASILTAAGTTAGLALLSAPAALAQTSPQPTYLTPKMTYTVSGNTMTPKIVLQGVQAYWLDDDNPSKSMAVPHNHGMRITYGDGTQEGLDGGAGVQCSTGPERVAFREDVSTWRPFAHTYAKPGTYKVTISAKYCAPGKETTGVSTYFVTVGSKASTPKPTVKPTETATAMPKVAPAPTAKVGPKVQTDAVAAHNSSNSFALVGGSAVVALTGAAFVVRRRRAQD